VTGDCFDRWRDQKRERQGNQETTRRGKGGSRPGCRYPRIHQAGKKSGAGRRGLFNRAGEKKKKKKGWGQKEEAPKHRVGEGEGAALVRVESVRVRASGAKKKTLGAGARLPSGKEKGAPPSGGKQKVKRLPKPQLRTATAAAHRLARLDSEKGRPRKRKQHPPRPVSITGGTASPHPQWGKGKKRITPGEGGEGSRAVHTLSRTRKGLLRLFLAF